MAGYNHFNKIADGLGTVLAEIVSDTAHKGTQHVMDHIKANGQVDTGFMLNSAYTVTHDGSSYGQGGYYTDDGRQELLPEVSRPSSPLTAKFAVGAPYAVPQNYGTVHLPPRPFWEPALDDTAQDFQDKLGTIEERLARLAK